MSFRGVRQLGINILSLFRGDRRSFGFFHTSKAKFLWENKVILPIEHVNYGDKFKRKCFIFHSSKQKLGRDSVPILKPCRYVSYFHLSIFTMFVFITWEFHPVYFEDTHAPDHTSTSLNTPSLPFFPVNVDFILIFCPLISVWLVLKLGHALVCGQYIKYGSHSRKLTLFVPVTINASSSASI